MPKCRPSCSARSRCRSAEVDTHGARARQGSLSERVQKLLAAAGHGSRRQIEQWIRSGRLTINGGAAVLGARVAEDADIRLDGRRLALGALAAMRREVLLYHKPAGEVTTRSDPAGRPTVFERLPEPQRGRWVAIGRLDVNTTGLLLFTTDGALAHRLMHPSSQLEREYLVRVRGRPDATVLDRLTHGVTLEDGPARFDRIEAAAPSGSRASHTWFRVVLHEGRNREVRRLWEAVGFEVSRLSRLRYGPIALPADLRAGQWRHLGEAEAGRLDLR
jgi:23S rRNA pseudouridine2605 synthase